MSAGEMFAVRNRALIVSGDSSGLAHRQGVQIQGCAGCDGIAARLAQESALHADALRRVAELEHQLRASERFAALGHFIVEERHGIANALTSVLGHAELVLMEPGLREQVRSQMKTIHEMSLRICESMQRLTSLDLEMQMAERPEDRKTLRTPSSAAAPQ